MRNLELVVVVVAAVMVVLAMEMVVMVMVVESQVHITANTTFSGVRITYTDLCGSITCKIFTNQ